jgi:uroporphyrinogen III methyltransferase/synthase
MSTTPSSGRVYLVGAGPGDPGLVTLRAVECLQQAEVVICDRLANPRLLDFAPQAKHVRLGDLHAPRAERYQHALTAMLAEAQAGRTVVRLKGGDPGIFGRLGEEAEALRAAGIPFEIVPGVSAALAAGACAGIPLTHRSFASAVAFVTGHECPGKSGASLDWEALAKFPGTLVIYMGHKRLGETAEALRHRGKSGDTPAAVVHWASMGCQRTVVGTLADIAERAEAARLKAPVVTIIGPVVALREQLAWFEQRPLFGKTVLVTRPRGQAAEMVRKLELLGATVHALPVVEIGPPPDPAAVDRMLGRLHEFDWLVFTSANGVRALLDRLLALGRDLRDLGPLRLAAIGPRTAAALGEFHLRPDLTPNEYRSEALVESLRAQVSGNRVLLARADRGRELLREELAKVCDVEEVAVYSQVDVAEADANVLSLLRSGQIDFVTLTSSNIAGAFVKLLDAESRRHLGKGTRLVTISPVTSAALRELGCEISGEARAYTADGLIAELLRVAQSEKHSSAT